MVACSPWDLKWNHQISANLTARPTRPEIFYTNLYQRSMRRETVPCREMALRLISPEFFHQVFSKHFIIFGAPRRKQSTFLWWHQTGNPTKSPSRVRRMPVPLTMAFKAVIKTLISLIMILWRKFVSLPLLGIFQVPTMKGAIESTSICAIMCLENYRNLTNWFEWLK